MKLTALTLVLMSLYIPTSGSAEPTEYEFRVAPSVGLISGDTRWELEFPYLRPDSSIGLGRSELVYSLNHILVGFNLEFRARRANRSIWEAEVGLAMNATDPGGDMTDRDWLNPGFGMLEFSSTESAAEGSLAMLGVEVRRLLAAKGRWELLGCIGFEYQVIKQQMVDLRGWQYDLDEVGLLERPEQVDSLTKHVIDDEILAGTYEVRYFRPQIGLMPRYMAGPWSIGLKSVVSPFLQVRDIDDHLLRGFQIKSSGRGFGYAGQLKIAYEAGTASTAGTGEKAGLRFSLIGEFKRTSADIRGFRIHYLASPDIPAGTVWAEQHKVTSTQYGVRFSLGFRF